METRCSRYLNQLPGSYQTEAEIRAVLEGLASPAPSDLHLYRWGRRLVEEARTGLIPAFELGKYVVNLFGAVAGGKGVYVAEDLISSARGFRGPAADLALITYLIKKDAPILCMDDRNIPCSTGIAGVTIPNHTDAIRRLFGDVRVVNECNPRVQVAHYPGFHGFWVLKDGTTTEAEIFDGRTRVDAHADHEELLLRSPVAAEVYRRSCNNQYRPRRSISDCP
jgi:hypothetical protein